MKKKLLALSLILTLAIPTIANAATEPKEWNGWWNNGANWEYYNNNEKVHDKVIKVQDHSYYINSDGARQSGWININNSWMYANELGQLQTGWIVNNNKWYYLDQNGIMLHGTTTPDGYKVGSDGAWI